ncbi:hypothetical protein AALP_AA6G037600 [Arabis alpina]|uniref:TF-B3 domain-containing protein n=1 Tax=Arabis alpina TaxID=50452 RepID=A0A087GLX6_ARAAL|nr:hypothetical protein AALP_AA6G037600 [Arabis alpina]
MATSDEDGEENPPRFFKVFISHMSSDSMLIPISYYDELPYHLPKTAILRGTGGCVWNVAIDIKKKQEEVHFGKGWAKFVKDNSLSDGDFLTFVYNGKSVFEVSIYGRDGCKEIRAVTEVEEDEEEVSICSLSSKDMDTCSESEMANAIPRSKNKGTSSEENMEVSDDDDDDIEDSVYSLNSEEDTDTEESDSEFNMASTIPRSKNKGKPKAKVVDDSDDFVDNVYAEDTDTDTDSEFKIANAIPRIKNKGKEKEEEVSESSDEKDSDSDYIEAFSNLDFEDNSDSDDSSYSLADSEETLSCPLKTTKVKPKVTKPEKKGKSKVKEDVDAMSESSCPVAIGKKMKKAIPKIKNPESYLDDPKNVFFESSIKNRLYELLVHAQLVKDYGLKFKDKVCYIDPKGELEAKTAKWKDERVCIKKWKRICERNKLKKKDRILCELLRRGKLVYAIKLHIFREKDL